jgi:tRNA pseudouridine38-40 synthase
MPNIKMIIAYDGKRYQGFQKNKNAKETIQEKLNETLSKYFEMPIDCIASGRTDKGVHALGQVINFRVNQDYDLAQVKKDLTTYLPKDIIIKTVAFAEERFHSRLNAKSKTYQYRLWKHEAKERPLFEREYVYELNQKVDSERMQSAARHFIGEHDFKGFSTDKSKKSTIRTITDIDIVETDTEIIVTIQGNGFLYNMVRIIMGTLIEIGTGDRKIETIETVFEEKDRSQAGYTVPAHGLCLLAVSYE